METDRTTLPTKRPLRWRSLHAEAVETLREMIIGGELAPGARLVEAELCALFAISRTPLREALRVLEVEGLVTFYPNRGAVVSTISPEEVVQQFEVLANLERIALDFLDTSNDVAQMRADFLNQVDSAKDAYGRFGEDVIARCADL